MKHKSQNKWKYMSCDKSLFSPLHQLRLKQPWKCSTCLHHVIKNKTFFSFLLWENFYSLKPMGTRIVLNPALHFFLNCHRVGGDAKRLTLLQQRAQVAERSGWRHSDTVDCYWTTFPRFHLCIFMLLLLLALFLLLFALSASESHGCHSMEVIGERRALVKLSTMIDNTSHPCIRRQTQNFIVCLCLFLYYLMFILKLLLTCNIYISPLLDQ